MSKSITNSLRPPTPAEIRWATLIRDRDDAGLRCDPIELALLKEIIDRWKAADAARAQRKS